MDQTAEVEVERPCTHSLFRSTPTPLRDRCYCFHGAFQSFPVHLKLSTFKGILSVVGMDQPAQVSGFMEQTGEVEVERER